MIFVTVGTNEARFDRLLKLVEEMTPKEEVVVQHGHSSAIAPPGATLVDFLAFDDLVAYVRRARAVVTHAGVGSVMVALANAKRPIVVPRLKMYAEAVDDHQLQLAAKFADAGLVQLAETSHTLADALGGDTAHAATIPRSTSLATDLGAYLKRRIVEAGPANT